MVTFMLSFFCSIMQAVLDCAVPYLHLREAFGQKIGHFQVWDWILGKPSCPESSGGNDRMVCSTLFLADARQDG